MPNITIPYAKGTQEAAVQEKIAMEKGWTIIGYGNGGTPISSPAQPVAQQTAQPMQTATQPMQQSAQQTQESQYAGQAGTITGKDATLSSPDNAIKIVVKVGSKLASQLQGRGWTLSDAGKRLTTADRLDPSVYDTTPEGQGIAGAQPAQTVAQQTVSQPATQPTQQLGSVVRDLAKEQEFVKNWGGKERRLPTSQEVNQGVYGTPSPSFTTPQGQIQAVDSAKLQLTSEQIKQLNRAQARIDAGMAGDEDKKNLDFAKDKYDFSADKLSAEYQNFYQEYKGLDTKLKDIENIDIKAPELSTEMQGLLSNLNETLQALIQSGKMISPDIEITPEQAAEFLTQSETEISPYYKELAKQAKEDLYSSIENLRQQTIASEKQMQEQYGRSLTNIGEIKASQGLTYSGRRQLEERQLASDYSYALSGGRRSLEYGASEAAKKLERYLGTSAVRDLSTTDIAGVPSIKPGEYGFSWGTEVPLYTLGTQDTLGSLEKEKTIAAKTRASELEAEYRKKRALEF